jgi:hypothetical protein
MMRNNWNFQITSNLPDWGNFVLQEEITLLTPYLMEKILEIVRADDRYKANQSSPLRSGLDGPTG